MNANYQLKRVADLLTLTRLVGVVIVPIIGLTIGSPSVAGSGGWLLILLWLTDLFDGQLAQKSGLAGEGFFADLDAWVDLLLALSGFTLLAVTGFVNPWVYGVAVAATLLLVRVDFLIFQGVTSFFLSVFYFVVACAQDETFLVGIAVFLGIHVVFSRERFSFLWNRFWGHLRAR